MRNWFTAGCAIVALAAVPSSASAKVVTASSDGLFCAPPGSARAAAKRPGPLGWLMRVTRDDDDDEPGRLGVAMSYYLRSPLLTSFFNIVPCPDKRLEDEPEDADQCALLIVRTRDGDDVVKVELPAAGATTPAGLRARVSEHQARGEPFLVVQSHGELELAAGAIREVRAGGC